MSALLGIFVLAAANQTQDLKKFVYPLAPAMERPEFVLDVSQAKEAEAWGLQAKALLEEWYGKLTQLLATDGKDPITGEQTEGKFKPYKQIKIIIKPNIDAPAYAAGGEITANADWIKQHPDDLGMMIHELVHVIQQYPGYRGKPGWLVEGIADYIRWWRYEPELHSTSGRTKIDFSKAKYTDSYRTTGMWLAWTSRKYNMALVPSLDLAMRNRQDPMDVFKKLTGKTADELWTEFSKSQ